jgi:hypothetical protein
VRTYLNTLLHRKRGAYGPLWIFELDPETWAVVWRGWLEDEATCHLILSENPAWFNRDWGMDGRRPNPTYRTQHAALEEVIRSLRAMMDGLKDDDAEQRQYAVYISDAEHDLHRVQTRDLHPSETTVLELENALVGPGVAGGAQTPEPAQPLAEVEKTPPAPAEPVQPAQQRASDPAPEEPAPTKKPWEALVGTPKGLNFQPSPELHGKMEWVSKNVPGGMSRLAILREGAMMLCNQLIAKHYRVEK